MQKSLKSFLKKSQTFKKGLKYAYIDFYSFSVYYYH